MNFTLLHRNGKRGSKINDGMNKKCNQKKIMINNIHHEVYLNLSVIKGQCLTPIIRSNRSLGECVRYVC